MNFNFLIPLAAILVSTVFAAVSIAWNSARRGTRSMAALFACTLGWGVIELMALLEPDADGALRWLRWIHLPPFMIGPVVLWIVAETLPRAKTASLKRQMWIAFAFSLAVSLASGLSLGAVESVLPNGSGGWVPQHSAWSFGLMALGCVVPGYGVFVASRSRRRAAWQRSDRRRAWGVGIAFAISATISFSTELVLPALDLPGPRLGALGIALSVAVIWLSVLHDDEDLLLTPQGVARALLERLQDGVALVRLDGQVLSCNPRFATLARGDETASSTWSGAEREQGPVGVSIETLIDAPIERIRAGVEDRASALRSATGESIPISLSSSVARSRTGAEIGFVVVVRDLREVDALRSHLVGAGRLAAIGELAAGIAHEVNNPVAFMRSDFNLMRERVAEVRTRLLETTFGLDGVAPLDRSGARIDRALDGLGRVTEVVVDVRDFAHAGGARQGGSDPVTVVEGAMRLARLERDGEVVLAIDRAHAPSAVGCGQELKQALLAILRLLAGATEKGGRIGASLRGSDAALEVELMATPLRADATALEERFAGLAIPRSDRAVDLALVAAAELVESLGGRLSASSVGESGLRVELEVPLQREEERT